MNHGYTDHGQPCCDLALAEPRPNHCACCGGTGHCSTCWSAAGDIHHSTTVPQRAGTPADQAATVARARTLAADYQANPTPARAHNAAQALGAVLGTLDAVVARTFAITDENTRLAEVTAELARVRTEVVTLCRAADPVTGYQRNSGTCRAWTLDPSAVEGALGLAIGGIVDPTNATRIGGNS